jgi:hypothetical protein
VRNEQCWQWGTNIADHYPYFLSYNLAASKKPSRTEWNGFIRLKQLEDVNIAALAQQYQHYTGTFINYTGLPFTHSRFAVVVVDSTGKDLTFKPDAHV